MDATSTARHAHSDRMTGSSAPVCVLWVTQDGTVSRIAGTGQNAIRHADGISLFSFLPVSRTGSFGEAIDAVRREGVTRNVRWHSPGPAFPGDANVAGRRLARIVPCAESNPPGAVSIVLQGDPDLSGANDDIGLQSQLNQAHSHLFQSEKMAAIGQLAAGVAHEINNPVGFVSSNLCTLAGYVRDLLTLTDAIDSCTDVAQLRKAKSGIDYAFMRNDVESLIRESEDGIDRIKRIISALKDFTHQDEEVFRPADLRKGIETTLKVVNSELKYKADVVTEFGDVPVVECVASQINQVIMNLLVNAAHAMENFGRITVRTGATDEMAWIDIEDNGSGIPEEIQSRIFEPFFTTKPVGKGTGLGLALSYNIVQKHGGRIDLESKPGKGTRFRIWLPLKQHSLTGIDATIHAKRGAS